jgi:hypothetical protein
MNTEDRLDQALSSDIAAFAASSEVRALVDTGDEIGDVLGHRSLDAATRTRLYAEALAMSSAPSLNARLRAVGLDRRVLAIAGGAAVTFAAAGVSVAIARGRRRAPTTPAGLRA